MKSETMRDLLAVILAIINRGNTAEIRRRKGKILVLEVKKQRKTEVPLMGEE